MLDGKSREGLRSSHIRSSYPQIMLIVKGESSSFRSSCLNKQDVTIDLDAVSSVDQIHQGQTHHLIVFSFRQDLPSRFDLGLSAVLSQHVIVVDNSLNESLLKVYQVFISTSKELIGVRCLPYRHESRQLPGGLYIPSG